MRLLHLIQLLLNLILPLQDLLHALLLPPSHQCLYNASNVACHLLWQMAGICSRYCCCRLGLQLFFRCDVLLIIQLLVIV